jgi:hypothetical protein
MTYDVDAKARELCGVGCGCSDENAERCEFAGRMGQSCRRQERAIAKALREAREAALREAALLARQAAKDCGSSYGYGYPQRELNVLAAAILALLDKPTEPRT